MIEKTSCQQCGTHIEFDIDHANQFVACPSCGQQTRLLLPSVPKTAAQSGPKQIERLGYIKPMRNCGDCGFEISKRAVFCPKCGGFNTVPFGLVWIAVGLVMGCSAIYGLIVLIIDEIRKAIMGET